MKRVFTIALLLSLMVLPVSGEPIKWVDFHVSKEAMEYALRQDIATLDQEKHIGWIEILSLAACRTGGTCGLASVKQAARDLQGDKSPEELLGALYKYYAYYYEA